MNDITITPDQPIKHANEDILGYSVFVNRLLNALVQENADGSYRSTGVVLGLTGEWGTGKSSILNLLKQELSGRVMDRQGRYKPIIVSFNPWLLTSPADLLSHFINELASAIYRHNGIPGIYRDRYDQRIDEITGTIREYGALLTPLLDLAAPGLSVPANIGLRGFAKQQKATPALSQQKEAVEQVLSDLKVPVVVLVDELDRVSDEEIQMIVRIVKSILDFPSVSYLIAFDKLRVAEALSGSDTSKDGQSDYSRGFKYLEKLFRFRFLSHHCLTLKFVNISKKN